MNLPVGHRTDEPGAEVSLAAERFNRHTFWCGQSGSGKTYALGVVIEQLLLHTQLPLLILDPNADFVRLREPRADADPAAARALSGSDIRILNSTSRDGEQLRTRFLELSTPAKAAVLQLDPIADADEYNVLLRVDVTPDTFDAETFNNAAFLAALRESDDPGRRRLALRIENLQVLEWDLWSRGGDSVNETVDARPSATVLDLGGFAHPAEPKVAALGVLEHLWINREQRCPVLIVIDEAHNVCSPNPETPVERALTELLIQIAAEGRKFGLWLLLSSQRPTKIHPNVLSQCDNLCLMRMNAPRDLTELADVFGFVPRETLMVSPEFRQGQALLAGSFIPSPTFTQMGTRITEEGGADVRVPLRGA